MSAHDPRVTGVDVWAIAASPRSTWVVVRVSAGGMDGVGELSDGGHVARVLAAARDVAALTLDQDLVSACSAVTREVEARRAKALEGSSAFLWSTVLGGFTSAFADLAARLAGQPLSVALGHGEPAPVRAYANLNRRWGADGPVVVAAEAAKAVAAGLTAVKVAPFSGPDHDGLVGPDALRKGLRTVHAVRDVLPDGVHLMVDCHHRVPAELVQDLARGLEPLAPLWVEDLVDVTDLAALRSAARATNLPLAAGEHVWDPRVAAAATATGALAFWLLDPKHAGGPVGSERVASAVTGTALTFHNPSGPVGTAHAIHLSGLAGGATWLELAWGEHDGGTFTGRPELVDGGRLRAARGTGAGCLPGPVHAAADADGRVGLNTQEHA